jgi:DNA replication and repair protein RecF
VQLTGLSVRNFRSWGDFSIALEPGVTVFLGPNGQGKTNLVEAIGYIATLSSHRVASDAPLIKHGTDQARIQVGIRDIHESERINKVEVSLAPGRSAGALVNGNKPQRTRDILGLLRTVLFAPEDLALVKGDPSERRRFLDELLVARYPRYAAVMADYSRIIKQRSSLLKTAPAAVRNPSARESLHNTLDVWDEQCAMHGARLIAGRLETLDMLRGPAVSRHDWLTSGGAQLQLNYQAASATTATVIGQGRPSEALLQESLREDLRLRRDDEIRRGVTLVGPQRDDIAIGLGELPAKGYASHGESWSIALALRLGSFDVLREQYTSDPVLILDDVFAELDTARRKHLTEAVQGVEQVIITAAVQEDVPAELLTRCIAITREIPEGFPA